MGLLRGIQRSLVFGLALVGLFACTQPEVISGVWECVICGTSERREYADAELRSRSRQPPSEFAKWFAREVVFPHDCDWVKADVLGQPSSRVPRFRNVLMKTADKASAKRILMGLARISPHERRSMLHFGEHTPPAPDSGDLGTLERSSPQRFAEDFRTMSKASPMWAEVWRLGEPSTQKK